MSELDAGREQKADGFVVSFCFLLNADGHHVFWELFATDSGRFFAGDSVVLTASSSAHRRAVLLQPVVSRVVV